MRPGSNPGGPLVLSFFVSSCNRHPAANGCLYFMQNRGDTMARAPDQRVKQAEVMFHSGKKLVEIANELNLPQGTVGGRTLGKGSRTFRKEKRALRKESERSERKKESCC